jgi:hypothetical protein
MVSCRLILLSGVAGTALPRVAVRVAPMRNDESRTSHPAQPTSFLAEAQQPKKSRITPDELSQPHRSLRR